MVSSNMTSQIPDQAFVESHIRPNVDPSDWISPEAGDEHYSPNQMIGAFNAGEVSGLNKWEAVAQQMLTTNDIRSAKLTSDIIGKMREAGLHPVSALLKAPETFTDVDVLITIPIDEFNSARFLSIYEFVGEIEQSTSNAAFAICFHFAGRGDDFDENKVRADGYIYNHRMFS